MPAGSSAISCSAAAADVQAELAAILRGIEACLCRRIVRAVEAGQLGAGTDADALAGHVITVIQGKSTLIHNGAPRNKLTQVAAVAMLA